MATRPTAADIVPQLAAVDSSARTSDDYDAKSVHDVETPRQPQNVVKEDPGVARIEALCESHRLFTGRQSPLADAVAHSSTDRVFGVGGVKIWTLYM